METFNRFQPEVLIHAAAFKHVPLTEANPLQAVRNNGLGTNVLAESARSSSVSRLVMVSTDKAVNPKSIMGASKRIAELALLRWNDPECQMRALRLGNVLGSEGSVLPAFEKQIREGGPVTVTHPDVERYFLEMKEAVDLILLTAVLDGPAGVFIPELREPIKIVDLARRLIQKAGFTSGEEISIVFTGLRPGDKMTEEFVSDRELAASANHPRLHHVKSPLIPVMDFDLLMQNVSVSVERRDLAATLALVVDLVPEYQASELLIASLDPPRIPQNAS